MGLWLNLGKVDRLHTCAHQCRAGGSSQQFWCKLELGYILGRKVRKELEFDAANRRFTNSDIKEHDGAAVQACTAYFVRSRSGHQSG